MNRYCAFCGNLGHTQRECPELEEARNFAQLEGMMVNDRMEISPEDRERLEKIIREGDPGARYLEAVTAPMELSPEDEEAIANLLGDNDV
jgi:hypothetical protein